jgi:hypothetical protein
VVHGWGDCGNYPAKYYGPTVSSLVDEAAWTAAVGAGCGGS